MLLLLLFIGRYLYLCPYLYLYLYEEGVMELMEIEGLFFLGGSLGYIYIRLAVRI